jgi:phosphoribosylaminoimidazolecarboxamide formyltransferase/IMP cyclohydrolase
MDVKTAKVVAKSGFLECIIAPGFDKEALVLFKDKKNLRLLELADFSSINEPDFKRVNGALLLQEKDTLTIDINNLKVVTKKKPTEKEKEALIFAWKVAKHVKSNAIILARGNKTVGIGAGQMSRVDSVFISTKKAGKLAAGCVLASDAFFPKEDAIQLAAKYKIKAIIQPGGSIADEAIIKMADKYKIAMLFTGIRHFRH